MRNSYQVVLRARRKKDGANWFMRVYYPTAMAKELGRRFYDASTKTSDEAEALRIAEETEASENAKLLLAVEGVRAPREGGPTVAEAMAAWVSGDLLVEARDLLLEEGGHDKDLVDDVTDGTRCARKHALRLVTICAIGSLPLTMVKRRHFMEFREELAQAVGKHGKPFAAVTIATRYLMIGKFWKLQRKTWEAKTGHQLARWLPGDKSKICKTEREAWTQGEHDQVLEWFRVNRPAAYLLVFLQATCATRMGEICGLGWENVNLAKGRLELRKTKTGEPRNPPLIPAAIELLRAHHESRRSERWVFVGRNSTRSYPQSSIHDLLAKARLELGLSEHVTFHGLRKRAAREAHKRGAGIKTLAAWLGHASLKQTASYIGDEPEENLLAAALSVPFHAPTNGGGEMVGVCRKGTEGKPKEDPVVPSENGARSDAVRTGSQNPHHSVGGGVRTNTNARIATLVDELAQLAGDNARTWAVIDAGLARHRPQPRAHKKRSDHA